MAPYTDEEDATTTWGMPCRRAASSTVMVPVALTRWVAMGSASERGTDGRGGQVDDRLGPLDDVVEIVRAQNGAFPELDRGGAGQVLTRAGRQVVERHHMVDEVLAVEHPAEVRTDEAGTTGDDDFHRR